MVKKFNTEICDEKMTFNECELAILRNAVDETNKLQGKETVKNDDVQKMISILENFLIKNKQLCYGGTAINNILPKYDQFYNRELEIPDYDFYSKTALEHAKQLADIYYNEGFTDVEAKSGVHKGTYKIFVNFIPIADITFMNSEIYDNLVKEAITISGIRYCPPNYLRMSMYLELSRPAGDVTRWEKIFKRLTLLNKHFPLKPEIQCNKLPKNDNNEEIINENIFTIIRDSFIDQDVVFFGGYATYIYSRYMPQNNKMNALKVPQFDVIAETPEKCALIIKERLSDEGIKNIEIIQIDNIEDIIPRHFEIKINKKSYAYIYQPIACHSYNTIEIKNKNVNIATIYTMLSFYLAFIYTNNKHYNKDRILCLAKYLFEVEQHNRLQQKNVLKHFSTKCYGKQQGLTGIRAEKSDMFKKLGKQKNSTEYEKWFLKYVPEQMSKKEKDAKKKKVEKFIEKSDIYMDEINRSKGKKKSIKKKNDDVEEEKEEEEEQEEQEEEEKEKEEEKIKKPKLFRNYKKNFRKRPKTKKKNSILDNFFNRKTRKGFLF